MAVGVDAVEAVERSLRALDDHAHLNAVVTTCYEEARARACARVDGPLAGRTLLVKDLFDTAGIRTTYGSSIYAEHVPERTAPAVERVERAGAIVVGKANLHEFAWGVTSQNPHYGTVQNPRHPGRTSGGSSGGNAAALAAGLVDIGLGTDTGCSVRLPSSCCGTVGLKTSWGSIPTEGCFPLCPSFDTVGPMTRTVADCALVWSVLAERPAPGPQLAGLTVGLLTRPPSVGGDQPPANAAAQAYVERLEGLGALVVERELPLPEADTWPLFFAEAAESHRATFPARADEYGDNVRAKLEHAQTVSPQDVEQARAAIADWRRLRPDVDLYVSPVLGIEIPPVDCEELEVRIPCTAYARPFNILGWAALAIGDLQLIAPRDETVLAAGLAWEEAFGPPG